MNKEQRDKPTGEINPETGGSTDVRNWAAVHLAMSTRQNPAVSMPLAVVTDDRYDVWDNAGRNNMLQVCGSHLHHVTLCIHVACTVA